MRALVVPNAPPPTLQTPNMPSAAVLAQGTGSNLTATWAAPAVDSTHDAAAGYNLRSSPSGVRVAAGHACIGR